MQFSHNSSFSEASNHGLFFYSSGEEFLRFMEMELPRVEELQTTTFLFAIKNENIEKIKRLAESKHIPSENQLFVDATAIAGEIQKGGKYRPEVFQDKIELKVKQLMKNGGRLWVFGEIVDVLCEQGFSEVANQLEADWNGLLEKYPFYLLCGYKRKNFSQLGLNLSFDRVCKGHNKHLSLHCGTVPSEKLGILKLEHDNFLMFDREKSRAEESALVEMGRIHQEFLHELKNILLISNINFSRIQQMESSIIEGDREKFQKAVKGMAMTQDRLNQMVKESTDFVKLHPSFWTKVQLGELLQKASDSMGVRLKGANIGLDVSLEELQVSGSEFLLEQVILKTLEFSFTSLDQCQDDGRARKISVSLEKNNGVAEIRIHDNGNGIKSEYLNHMFHPFYTSKMKLGAPGLGLSYCKKIVQAHLGDMRCESVEGKGTTFHIHLPVVQQ